MKKPSRLALAALLAGALSIAFSGVVVADSSTGSIGNYLMHDNSTFQSAGATCRYNPSSPGSNLYHLYRIVGRAPSVWWPDTNSSIANQHGKVGWQLIIKYKLPASSTWALLKKSDIQKAVAYEDAPDYDTNDQAPFTNIYLNINYANFPDASTEFQAYAKVFWYRADGSVRGTLTHQYVYYRIYEGSTAGGVSVNQFCRRSFLVI